MKCKGYALKLVLFSLLFAVSGQILAEDGFEPLFDGKTLKGWSGREGLWSVRDGAVVGSTRPDGLKGNTFLVHEGSFEDFTLRLEFKLLGHNSGVQFRTSYKGDPSHHVVKGYQADIGRNYFGNLHDEAGRGVLHAADQKWLAHFLKEDDWNRYEISAQGNKVTLKINDLPTTEYVEKDSEIPRQGFIALQLHRGSPMEIHFRNIRIKEKRRAKLLYVTTAGGFAHSSRPLSRQVVRKIGFDSGEFEATVTDSPDLITPGGLRNFDAVMFYTTGSLRQFPLAKENREHLIQWVREGHAFIGVHSATDTYGDWQPYWEMIGGTFDGHPWHEDVKIDVEDPSHPAALPIPHEWVIKDEIYQFKNYSRNRFHIILSMNPASVKGKGKRVDNDYPIAWCRAFGKGKVFYTSLGHREDVWTNPVYQAHLLGGIGWAIDAPGYEGDATPGLPKPSNQFVSLFDGKTLSGWTENEGESVKDSAEWFVTDGGIVTAKGRKGHLFSPRSYENFHYKADIKINDRGNSGMYFRTTKGRSWPTGFEAQINSSHGDPVRTGSLYSINKVFTQLVSPDTWFTQEVIAFGGHIVIKVNGKITSKVKVPTSEQPYMNYRRGHFAFQFHDPTCRVQLRNVMVRELPSVD